MTEPSKKSPEMEQTIDEMSMEMFGRKRTESIRKDICVMCGNPATEFQDELNKKEFTVSGMCQKCQDKTFGGGKGFNG